MSQKKIAAASAQVGQAAKPPAAPKGATDVDDVTSAEPADETTTDSTRTLRAWTMVQLRVLAIAAEAMGDSLPRVSVLLVVNSLLVVLASKITPHAKAAVGLLNSKIGKEYDEAVANLKIDALALAYAYGMFQSTVDSKNQRIRENFAREISTAEALRARGLHWLEALAHHGYIDPDEVTAIRKGRGHLDLASDLITISAFLAESWKAVESMLPFELDPDLRITRDDVDEMDRCGASLLETIGAKTDDDSSEIDWRFQVIAIYRLMEQDYAKVCALLTFYHTHIGRPERSDDLISFNSMQARGHKRPGRKPAAISDEKPEPEPEPQEPVETPDESAGGGE